MSNKVHIKQLLRTSDAFLTTSEKIYAFYQVHTKPILIALGALILAAAAALVFWHIRESRNEASASALFRATSVEVPSAVLPALEKVRADYPGSPAARLAAFAMVPELSRLGRYAEAAATLADLADSPSPGEDSLRPLIFSNLGGLYEDAGDPESALRSYKTALALAEAAGGPPESATGPFKSQVMNSVARLSAELGQTDEAKRLYRQLAARYPATIRGFAAKYKLALLEGPTAPSPGEPSQPQASGTGPGTGESQAGTAPENAPVPAPGEVGQAQGPPAIPGSD
jgi:tetratricopeptide (TPR) repeat protein